MYISCEDLALLEAPAETIAIVDSENLPEQPLLEQSLFEEYGIEIAIGGGLTAVIIGGSIYLYNRNKQPKNPNPAQGQKLGSQQSDLGSGSGSNPAPVQQPGQKPGSGSGSGSNPNPAPVQQPGQKPGSGSNPNPAPIQQPGPQPVPNPQPVQQPGSGSNPSPAPVQQPGPQPVQQPGSGSNPSPTPVQQPGLGSGLGSGQKPIPGPQPALGPQTGPGLYSNTNQQLRKNIADIIQNYQKYSAQPESNSHKPYGALIAKLQAPDVQENNLKFRQNMIKILANNLKGDKFVFNIKDTKYALFNIKDTEYTLSKAEMTSFTTDKCDLEVCSKCHKLVDMLMALLSTNMESDEFTTISYGDIATDKIELLYVESIDQFICSMNALTDENMTKLIKKIFTHLETHELTKEHLKQTTINYQEKYKNLDLNLLNKNIISEYINLRIIIIITDNTIQNIFDTKLIDENIDKYKQVDYSGQSIPISYRDSLCIEIIHMHTEKNRDEIWETIVKNKEKPENEQEEAYRQYDYLVVFTYNYTYNNTLGEDINKSIDQMSEYLNDSLILTVNSAPIEPKPSSTTDKRLTINEIRELYKSQPETLKFINNTNLEKSDLAIRRVIIDGIITELKGFKRTDLVFKIDNKEYTITGDELKKFKDNKGPSEESLKNIYSFTDMYLSLFAIKCQLKHKLQYMGSLQLISNTNSILKSGVFLTGSQVSPSIHILPITKSKEIICAFSEKENENELLCQEDSKSNLTTNFSKINRILDIKPTTYKETEIKALGLNLNSYKYEDIKKMDDDLFMSFVKEEPPANPTEPKSVNPPIKPIEPKPSSTTDKRLTINEIRELYKSQTETPKLINDANLEASDLFIRTTIIDNITSNKTDLMFKIDNKEYITTVDELTKFKNNEKPSDESLKNIYLFTDMYLSLFAIQCQLQMTRFSSNTQLKIIKHQQNILQCSSASSCIIHILPIEKGKQIVCAFSKIQKNDSLELLPTINTIAIQSLLRMDKLPDQPPTTYEKTEIEALGLNLNSCEYKDIKKMDDDLFMRIIPE
jgi:hypothetical protein